MKDFIMVVMAIITANILTMVGYLLLMQSKMFIRFINKISVKFTKECFETTMEEFERIMDEEDKLV